MKLHENKEAFTQAVLSAAEYFKIQEIFIEKDYWVTYVLKNLAKSKFKEKVVFKGGTSLSKAHRLINRFSEDIDLAIIQDKDMSGNAVKSLITNIEKEITKDFTEVNLEGVTSKFSKFRKTVFEYPREIEGGNFGQAKDKLLLEINSFANPHPYGEMDIQTMIADFLIQTGRREAVGSYELEAFSVNVLGLERTLTEKVLALVRASYAENPINELEARVRHLYDLHYMLSKESIRNFIAGTPFKEMIKQVLADDESNSQFQGAWTKKPLHESLFISDWENIWKQLIPTYNGIFKTLVFSELPDNTAIDKSIKQIVESIVTNQV